MEVIKEISQEEMSKFLERIYENEDVKTAIFQSKNLPKAKLLTDYIGEFLVHYAVSTGDFSDEKISYLATHIAKEYESASYIKKDELFDKTVAPVMIWQVAKDIGAKQPLSLQDMALVLYNIELQNKNNQFYTHSFNGALFDEVNQNGLDISKELFTDEFKLLSQIGISTPFATGKLLLCELSYASFGYLHSNPERIYMAFGGSIANQKDWQTQQEYLTECLFEKIEKSGLDETRKKEMLQTGKKIIDFYTKSDNVCMAVKKQANVGIRSTSSQNFFFNNLSALGMNLPYKISKQLETKKFSDACRAKDFDKVEQILQEWTNQFPEIAPIIEKEKMNSFSYALRMSALNNFSTALADGKEVQGGKLRRSDFALSNFVDPVKTFPREHHKNMDDKKSQAL